MAHHKKPTKIDVFGTKVRLRRDRKGSPTHLTKGGRYYNSDLPNPHPDGGQPTTAWVLAEYPRERKRRKERAAEKRAERRRILRRQKREALRED